MTSGQAPKNPRCRAGLDYIGIGVAAIIVNSQGRVALLRRLRRAGKGLWGLPGGRVKVGETFEHAILREVQEELGVTGTICRQLGISEDIADDGHWISALFVVGDIIGTPRNREPRYHEALEWFALDDLPKELMSIARVAIEKFQK